MYKAPDGSSFGTKNLHDHVKNCNGHKSLGQLKLMRCIQKKLQMTKKDSARLKQMEVEYCIDGYNSFHSVKLAGLHILLQICVDFRMKYGKIDI